MSPKFLSMIVGASALALVGVVQAAGPVQAAEPIQLSAAQMDSVTAAGKDHGGNWADWKKHHWSHWKDDKKKPHWVKDWDWKKWKEECKKAEDDKKKGKHHADKKDDKDRKHADKKDDKDRKHADKKDDKGKQHADKKDDNKVVKVKVVSDPKHPGPTKGFHKVSHIAKN
jgi:hypothetical protein